jgi:hypothetical protein
MALPFDVDSRAHDGRSLTILAKTIYRELRAEGYAANEVMALASELLGLVASEVKDRRVPTSDGPVVRTEAPVEARS